MLDLTRLLQRIHPPFFTKLGWAVIFLIGVIAGIIGGMLYSMAINAFA